MRAASSLRSWFGASVFLALLLGLNAHPWGASRLGLDVWKTVGAWALAVCCGLCVSVLRRRDGPRFSRQQAIALLAGAAVTQFLAATLFLLVHDSMRALFAMFVVTTGFASGTQTRVGAKRPWMLVGTALALPGALVWTAAYARWDELAVLGGAMLLVELVAGEMAWSQSQAVEEGARMRAAVHAQILGLQERDAERVGDALREVGRHSDAIADAAREAQVLCDLVRGMAQAQGPRHSQVAQQLLEQVKRIENLAQESSAAARLGGGPDREPVQLEPVAGLIRESVGFRFPQVKLEVERSGPLDEAVVLVPGGASSLRRIIENVLLNACEGDGQTSAARVVIGCKLRPAVGQVTLDITDDGPGFPEHVLAAPLEGLLTTKEGRQNGLGLYTAACLLRAGGGSLERFNTPNGGARVHISLPLDRQPASLAA